MSNESTATGTVRFHRVFKSPPERVYRAILESDAVVKWLPPYGFTCTVIQNDVREGGGYTMAFTNFGTGNKHVFSGKFVELKPGERIVKTDIFDDANLAGEMKTTFTMRANLVGTELTIVQEGIPAAIPADGCYLGWQESLAQLAKLVDPAIPDGA